MVLLLPRAPAAAAAASVLMLLGVVARTGAVHVGCYLSEADVKKFEAIGKGECGASSAIAMCTRCGDAQGVRGGVTARIPQPL